MTTDYLNFFYLVSACLFIFSLKEMSHARTAVRGNILGSLGMLIAVSATLFDQRILSYEMILSGVIAGSLVGVFLAYRPPITEVPQVIAIFNGLGAGASALAVGAVLEEALQGSTIDPLPLRVTIAAVISGFIGGVSFTGSAIAFGKLQGIITGRAVLLPGRHFVNALLLLGCVFLSAYFVIDPTTSQTFWMMLALALVLGVLAVIPIGGGDMPVVISLMNAYSGLAAAGYGWVLNNMVLMIGGALVGAAGFILTIVMSKAMNRSLSNVMFAGVSAEAGSASSGSGPEKQVKSTSAEEVAMLLENARDVVVVPGYGMAVGHAQHAVEDLCIKLESRGINVNFGIHPVAGRMPGHMNVLLAEANIPYDKLKDLDEINPAFKSTDVVLVVGANDIVNTLARNSDPSIAIAGMPILNVDEARSVVIIKRSLSPGFAGISNPLFYQDNVLMLFGDSKQMLTKVSHQMEDV